MWVGGCAHSHVCGQVCTCVHIHMYVGRCAHMSAYSHVCGQVGVHMYACKGGGPVLKSGVFPSLSYLFTEIVSH